jgi:hypothetical protein
MIVVIIVIVSLNILISIFNLFLLRDIRLAFADQKSVLKEESVKTDPFIEEVMHYAFNRGIQPLAMPGQDGKNTLFDSDKTGAYAICELFTTTHKQGTKGYNELLKKLKDQIDYYSENKVLIKEKIMEQKNDK